MAGRRTIQGSSFGVAPAALLLALLAGCGGLPGAGGDGGGTASAAASRTTQLVETDVEAPEVFQVTDQGLWDGRPSLGGVWVAHPDVVEPERVIIRNQDNGQFVIGALFRRERDNPGPALQVSSDAAEALGMLAGAPASVNVTALRREEAAAPSPTEATDPVGVPEEAAAAEDPAAAEPAAVTTTSLDSGEAVAAAPAPDAPLLPAPANDGSVAAATAAILGGAAAASAAPGASASPVAAPASDGPSTLERPFIQLGIFSVEANADELAQAMGALGLPARVAGASTQGQEFWRVLVGPAPDEATRASYLARVQAEGFADAYAVRN